MKYKIITAKYQNALNIANDLRAILKDHVEDNNKFDYLFIIGGDGTYAQAVRDHVYNAGLKIIGIHGGNLSFFSTYNKNNLSEILDLINANEVKCYKTFHLIEAEINNQKFYAFNDVLLMNYKMLNCDIILDHVEFETYFGTGILFSTKYGSTAYNKSANGPILFPHVQAWIMNELFPVNSNKTHSIGNPVIMPLEMEIVVNDKSRYPTRISCDGIEVYEMQPNDKLKLSLVHSTSEIFLPCDTKTYTDKLASTFIKKQEKNT